MAIWQYTFQVLQQVNMNTLTDDYFLNKSIEDFDEDSFWNKYPLNKTSFSPINSVLKKTKSWSKH